MVEVMALDILTDTLGLTPGGEGMQRHPPLRGRGGEYYGHEWSRWRHDTLDEGVDALLRTHRVPARILDAGCATGARAAQFAARGHHVAALDIVDQSAAVAARVKRLGRAGAIRFIRADIRAMPATLLSPPFDLINIRRVITFVPAQDLDRLFERLAAGLAADGVVAASFIATGLDRADTLADLPPCGAEALQLAPGVYAHHCGAVHEALRAQGLRVTEHFTDGRAEAGLLARRV